jgi:hypothetical protein
MTDMHELIPEDRPINSEFREIRDAARQAIQSIDLANHLVNSRQEAAR